MNNEARSLNRAWAKMPTRRDLARMLREVLVVWMSARYDAESEWYVSVLRRQRNAIKIASDLLDRVEFGQWVSYNQTELVLKMHRRAKAKRARNKLGSTSNDKDT